MAPLVSFLSGGFVLLVYYCFGFNWQIIASCFLSGAVEWCLVEIALGVNRG